MDKRQLQEYRHILDELEQMQEQRAQLRARLLSPALSILDDQPRGSALADGFSRFVAEVEELDRRKLQKLHQAKAALERLECCLDLESLTARERLLLRYRYLSGLAWEEIAVKMNYSLSMVYQLHGDALRKIRAFCSGDCVTM